jgi:trehalose 6-phosphate phosphatase
MQTQQILSPDSFLDIIKNHKKVFFIFDYDGTLVYLNKEHNQALLSAEQFSLLNQLATTPDTKISIVTGRSIANLKMLLADQLHTSAIIYGSHGGEKNEECRESNYTEHLEKIYEAFVSEPHIAWERKPLSITLHYKEHPNREELKSRLDKEADKHSHLFRVQTGHDVYEFLPKDINKGLAIEDINQYFPDYYLVFLGDDLTDNFGFKVINKLNGLSIQVSDRMKERSAGYLINSVADTYDLIKSYLNHKNNYERTN